ncbi:MAG TPA: hypothetical protein VHD90_13025 [Phototrophicaceae bacterium]|nr:hypothetical protein [Phototrophicaceae bacterium]
MVRRTFEAVLVLVLLLTSAVAVYALYQVNQLQSAFASISQLQTSVAEINQQITSKNPYSMWTVGTGGDGKNPYIEWVALYPTSTLYPIPGAPSLHFTDQSAPNPAKPRSFEIGFYKYGPTWYSQNSITEFWLGNGGGGILSVAGNNNGGGEVQVRNGTDTDSIRLTFRDPTKPTILTETGIPLHFAATQGLIADNTQTFEQGIVIPAASGYAGQVIDGVWSQGSITVPTNVVTDTSLVLITPISQPKGQWWVSKVDAQRAFTVSSSAADESMNFNWMIVGF